MVVATQRRSGNKTGPGRHQLGVQKKKKKKEKEEGAEPIESADCKTHSLLLDPGASSSSSYSSFLIDERRRGDSERDVNS
jgi:hypothetical protein